MKIYVCNKLWNCFVIYSKEINLIFNTTLSSYNTRNVNDANYIITCISDETNYPIYGNPRYAIPRMKIKDINVFIEKLFVLKQGQKIVVFYHTPKVFNNNTINVCYSKHDNDSNNIVICPPAIKQYSFNNNIDKKYFISFKGNIHASNERECIFNSFSKYSNDKNIFIERSDNLYDYNDLMQNSIFSVIIQGDLPWSYRFTEAINAGSIPIIIKPKDKNIFAFQELINYSSFSIVVNSEDIDNLMTNVLPNIQLDDISRMINNLESVNNKYFISKLIFHYSN